MLQYIREWLVLMLLAFLPFHVLLVTAGTKLLEGPGHAPMLELALWKEGLLAVILVLIGLEYLWNVAEPSQGTRQEFDVLDALVVLLIVLSLFLARFIHEDWKLYAYGFKYDFLPLVLLFVFRRVPWSAEFQKRAIGVLLCVGVLVAAYGIATFLLPQKFFVWLGYSDLHSLYLPGAPLAAFQQIGGMTIRRIQSMFAGPNQFGMWLLLPWSAVLVLLQRRNVSRFSFPILGLPSAPRLGLEERAHQGLERLVSGFFVLVGIALLFTFSRAAWVAAATILFLSIALYPLSRSGDSGISAAREPRHWTVIGFSAAMLLLIMTTLFVAPNILLRTESTREHFRRPLEAVRTILAHPAGLGLGSAGPASNRVRDACMFLEEGADISWAVGKPDLCVFVGKTQIQPQEPCHCPFLPENWYLQIGVELGILGFILYIILIFAILRRLIFNYQLSIINSLAALSFLGVSIAALFLHAWEDSAVAYSVWTLVAVAVGMSMPQGKTV